MTGCEDFRKMFEEKIGLVADGETISKILSAFDEVSESFLISKWTPVYQNQDSSLPKEVLDYLESKRIEGCTKATIENKQIALTSFFKMVPKPVEQVTTVDVRMFLCKYQNEHGISDRSLECMRTILSAFWCWLVDEDIVTKNIVHPIHAIRYKKKQRHALDKMEFEIFRNQCENDYERALVEFMYSTGARVSEVIGVKLSDIDFRNGSVILFGKGQKERTSYLNAKAILTIEQYLKNRGYDSSYLFASRRKPHGQLSKEAVEKQFRIICDRAGEKLNKKITPHIIRHTTATHALGAGMPLDQISKLLGHSDVSVTRIYAETNQDDVKRSHSMYIV